MSCDVTRQRDPTSSVLRKTNKLVRASSLPDDVKKQVIVTKALPPRVYGFPNIHKRDVPLRPIVSAIGAPTYLLAKHLTTLLQPYIGGKPSYIRDSANFVEKLRKKRFNPGDILQCLRTSYFEWDGSFYEQTDGVAMGSPLSPVVANLFMEQFEGLAIETAVNKSTVWWR
ncbi:hypothetical protein Trydic_g10332 [Trypoxylus dichotomus]